MTTMAYYPGCSLTASAIEYDTSTRLVMARLGALAGLELEDIDDWTCCGASAVEPVSRLLTQALPARNLALVERMGLDQVLAPCSACYLNLLRVNKEAMADTASRAELNEALSSEGLSYSGGVRVRHLLDLLVNEFDAGQVAETVTNPLEGLVVAPYYGCQILRPYPEFDDPERPKTMEPILKACGAEVLDWDMGNRCCGASLITTHQDAALASVAKILEAAAGADVIATVCPMCQMNLEAYQTKALAGSSAGRISVAYLPQLMAVAMDMSPKQAGLDKNLAMSAGLVKRMMKKGGDGKDGQQENKAQAS